jgi:hypothetical protein
MDLDPRNRVITATMNEFCFLSGLGRNTVYEMLKDGRLESVRICKRLLIVVDSWRREIERQRAEGVPEYEKIKPAQEARRRKDAERRRQVEEPAAKILESVGLL